MPLSGWFRRLLGSRNTEASPVRQRSGQCSGSSRPRGHPFVEHLEERVLPAFNLSISNAATTGVAVTGGTFTATATGANINVGDLVSALNAGNDVAVSNGTTGTEAGDIVWQSGGDADLQRRGRPVSHAHGRPQ